MCFFRKNDNNSRKTLEDRALLENGVKTLNMLAIKFEEHAEINEKIANVAKKLTFVSPKPTAITIDKRISDKIDDMRILAERSMKKEDFTDVLLALKAIRELIEQR